MPARLAAESLADGGLILSLPHYIFIVPRLACTMLGRENWERNHYTKHSMYNGRL